MNPLQGREKFYRNERGESMSTRKDAMIVNALVRQALTSAQEVMGENGLSAVLRTKFSTR